MDSDATQKNPLHQYQTDSDVTENTEAECSIKKMMSISVLFVREAMEHSMK